MPNPASAREKYQEKPVDDESSADLDFITRKVKDLESRGNLSEHGPALSRLQAKMEKLERNMEQRAEALLGQRWGDFTRQGYEAARQDWDNFTPRSLARVEERYAPLVDEREEDIGRFVDKIKARHQTVEGKARDYRRGTKLQQLRDKYELERGDQVLPDKKRHQQIGEKQRQLSNERFLKCLEPDEELRPIKVQLEPYQDISLHEIGACVGAIRREEPQAKILEKGLKIRCGDRLDVLLPAVQSVFAQLEAKKELKPEILEHPVPLTEVIEALPDIAESERPEALRVEEKLAAIDDATREEEAAGSPAWGRNLVQAELGYKLRGEFGVKQGDLGFYVTAAGADYENLSQQAGATKIADGVLRMDQPATEGLAGAIFIMRSDVASADKIAELELGIFQDGLRECGFQKAFEELERPEIQEQVRAEFQAERQAIVLDFNNEFLGTITPSSSDADIRQAVLAVVDGQVAVKMVNFQLNFQRLLENPAAHRVSPFNLRASFSEIQSDLLLAQMEAVDFGQQLRDAGYAEDYITLAQSESTTEVDKYATVVNRVRPRIESILPENDSPEIQRALYLCFRDNPPQRWETEIDIIRRDNQLA